MISPGTKIPEVEPQLLMTSNWPGNEGDWVYKLWMAGAFPVIEVPGLDGGYFGPMPPSVHGVWIKDAK